MFFIVNKTKGTITLGDLGSKGLSLGPRQAIDLDKIMIRSQSEESKALKNAKDRGDIEVRIKDETKPTKVVKDKGVSSSPDYKEMKKEIVKEVKGVMSDLLKGQGGVSKEDLQDVVKTLLTNMPKKTETVIIRQDGENIKQDEEIEVDDVSIIEMNKRVVDKMMENVDSGEMKYREEVKKDDLMSNVDELEGLLGE